VTGGSRQFVPSEQVYGESLIGLVSRKLKASEILSHSDEGICCTVLKYDVTYDSYIPR